MRIVFMGTPDFAAASLQKLIDEDYEIVGVFTQPDRPKGRGMAMTASPVKVLAEAGMVRTAGRSTTMGNTTYHYGPNGAPAGTATRTGW